MAMAIYYRFVIIICNKIRTLATLYAFVVQSRKFQDQDQQQIQIIVTTGTDSCPEYNGNGQQLPRSLL